MTTPTHRALVSLAATTTITLALGALPSAVARRRRDRRAMDAVRSPSASTTTARDYVHVYLVGEKREWLLGRVEPGAIATLRIPDGGARRELGRSCGSRCSRAIG